LVEQQEHIDKKEFVKETNPFAYYLDKGKESITNNNIKQAREDLLEAAEHGETPELYLLLSNVYMNFKSYAKAAEYLKRGIELDSRDPELFVELGTIYYKLGELKAAEFYYEEALEIRPMNFSANFNLGIICRKKQECEKAIGYFRNAVLVNPGNFLALYNIGYCYQQLNDDVNAINYYKKSLNENPVSPEASFALGNMYKKNRDWKKAKEYFKASLRIKPNQPNVLTNLGIVFHYLGKFEDSKNILKEVLSLEPENPDAKVNLATTFFELGRFEKSEELYSEVLKKNNNDAITHFNYSLLLFAVGKYKEALDEYEWRIKTWDREIPLPGTKFWKGESLKSKKIVVLAEQGLGDAIQFVRYLSKLKELGAYVVLQTWRPLCKLFAENNLADEVTEEVNEIHDADYKVFLMSIPKIIKQFPCNCNSPYLKINPVETEFKLNTHNKLKVGIVWRGSPEHMYDFKRSVKLELFEKIYKNNEVVFYSLQKNVSEEERAELVKIGITDLSDKLNSFYDTAQFIEQLDLIISIDSAVAHLAGAMGKVVWMPVSKISDWRWGTSGRTTEWYKSMKLYRQNETGQWNKVFQKINHDLEQKVMLHKKEQEQQLALLKSYGLKLYDDGKIKSALIYFEKYLENNPEDCTVLLATGLIEKEVENYSLSIKYLEKLFENCPDEKAGLLELARLENRFGNKKAAEKYYLQLIQKDNNSEYLNEFGCVLQGNGRYEEAEKYLEKAIEQNNNVGYLLNYANNLYFTKKFDSAIEIYDKAIAQDDLVAAHVGKSFTYLTQKDFKNGFAEYEYVLSKEIFEPDDIKKWEGEEAAGKRILIYTEQGIGDSIQFMRFLKNVKEKGLYVIIGTTQALKPFFETSPFVDEVTTQKTNDADYYSSIMNLPKVFGLENEADFKQTDEIFKVDESLKNSWERVLKKGMLNVGLAWHTDSKTPTSKRRSMDKEALSLLLSNKEINFLIFEKDSHDTFLAEAEKNFSNIQIINESLWDVAAIISNLDLVISVDTALLHISASMNIPTWVLLPKYCDWRWTFDGETSYWYKNAKLYRQTEEGNWGGLIKKVNKDLHEISVKIVEKISPEKIFAETETYLANGDLKTAETLLSDYIFQFEDNPEFCFKLAFVKQRLGKLEEAVKYYSALLEITPENFDALNNIGVALKDLGHYSAANRFLKIALLISKDKPAVYNNLGLISDAQGKLDEAIDYFTRAIKLDSNFIDAELNLANTYMYKQKFNDALDLLTGILTGNSDNAQANFNKSLLYLMTGEYEKGFKYYEWRRKLDNYTKRSFSKEELTNQNVDGKKILLYDEQGYGDTIQFSRFVKLLKNKGAEIILQTHAALTPLMENCVGVDKAIPRESFDDAGIDYDYHFPLLSLPNYFSLSKEECRMDESYLRVDESKSKYFKRRFFNNNKIKVGLVWEGKTPLFNAHRSSSIEDFAAFQYIGAGFKFYSLQVGKAAARDRQKMEYLGIKDLSEAIKDFSDTAAILKNLDLMITIDTSVVHLAGALNVKTYLLLSAKADWRWGIEDNTIWYPEIEIFRQKELNNWKDVINKVLDKMNPMKWSSINNNNNKKRS
jgi:tetratricopeptide (TPR) repeat protein